MTDAAYAGSADEGLRNASPKPRERVAVLCVGGLGHTVQLLMW